MCCLKLCCWLCLRLLPPFPCFLPSTPTYTRLLLHLDSLVESTSTLDCMCMRGTESERSHPSLALTPPALLHTINRNWDRHTHSSPHSLQRERERRGTELVIILSLSNTHIINICCRVTVSQLRSVASSFVCSFITFSPHSLYILCLRFAVSYDTLSIFVLCCWGSTVYLSSSV